MIVIPIEVKEDTIRIRQKPLGGFIRFRTMTLKPGIKAVIGFKRGGGSEVQSFIFDKKKFNKQSAQSWVKSHKKKKIKKSMHILTRGISNES